MKIFLGWVEWRDSEGWVRVSRPGSWSREFKKAKRVEKVYAPGPHPDDRDQEHDSNWVFADGSDPPR